MKTTRNQISGAIACACGMVRVAAAADPPKYVESSLLQDEITTEGYGHLIAATMFSDQ
jgi:hypothetical protein